MWIWRPCSQCGVSLFYTISVFYFVNLGREATISIVTLLTCLLYDTALSIVICCPGCNAPSHFPYYIHLLSRSFEGVEHWLLLSTPPSLLSCAWRRAILILLFNVFLIGFCHKWWPVDSGLSIQSFDLRCDDLKSSINFPVCFWCVSVISTKHPWCKKVVAKN